MERNRPRVTVKEKILVHLLEYVRFFEAVEVPVALTQKGMASVIGVPRSHIALTLGGMLEENLVEVEKCRVKGESRRQNAYRLTHTGRQKAGKLRTYFEDMEIDLVSAGQSKGRETVREIGKRHPGLGLVHVLNSLDDGMRLELSALHKHPKAEESEPPAVTGNQWQSTSPEPEEPVEGTTDTVSADMPFRRVFCRECRSAYALQFEGPAEEYACPFCGNGPLLERMAVERPWASPVLMFAGLGVVFASLLLTLVFEDGICLVYPWGSLFGFVLFLWGLSKVGKWEGYGRRGLYFSGGVFAVAFVSLFGIALEYYEWSQLSNVYLVCLPFLVILTLPKPIPQKARFTMSVALSVLFILLGFVLATGIEIQGWDHTYSAIWVCFSLCSLLLALALKTDLDIRIWPLVLFSSGIFILGFMVMMVFAFDTVWSTTVVIATASWVVLAITLMSSFIERANWSERVVGGMRHGAAFSLGLGFGFFGVILISVEQELEGVVELAVGLPLIWYGAKDAIGHLLLSRLYIIVLLSVVEMATILALIWP